MSTEPAVIWGEEGREKERDIRKNEINGALIILRDWCDGPIMVMMMAPAVTISVRQTMGVALIIRRRPALLQNTVNRIWIGRLLTGRVYRRRACRIRAGCNARGREARAIGARMGVRVVPKTIGRVRRYRARRGGRHVGALLVGGVGIVSGDEGAVVHVDAGLCGAGRGAQPIWSGIEVNVRGRLLPRWLAEAVVVGWAE